MPRTIKYTCTVCGVERKDTNHWFIAVTTVFDRPDRPDMIVGIAAWDMPDLRYSRMFRDRDDAQHLCGEACALKFVSSQIAKPKRENESEKENERSR